MTPTGLGAYASRQTFTAGFSIRQTSEMLKKKILDYACEVTRQATYNMDIIDSNIVRTTDGRVLMSGAPCRSLLFRRTVPGARGSRIGGFYLRVT